MFWKNVALTTASEFHGGVTSILEALMLCICALRCSHLERVLVVGKRFFQLFDFVIFRADSLMRWLGRGCHIWMLVFIMLTLCELVVFWVTTTVLLHLDLYAWMSGGRGEWPPCKILALFINCDMLTAVALCDASKDPQGSKDDVALAIGYPAGDFIYFRWVVICCCLCRPSEHTWGSEGRGWGCVCYLSYTTDTRRILLRANREFISIHHSCCLNLPCLSYYSIYSSFYRYYRRWTTCLI